jgi:lipoate-protein ligase A
MRYLDLTLPTLAENRALDEALLLAADEGGPEVLRVWQWEHLAIILGAGGKIADDVDEASCTADGVSLARRSSGGGTVLLGPGCLLFSVVLSYQRDPTLAEIPSSYRYVLGRVIGGFAGIAPQLGIQGSSDVTLLERKISGNAQHRKRAHLMHHGTLLYDFDIGQVSRYLKPPPRQPEYRRQREHGDFITNLDTDAETLKRCLRDAWDATEVMTEWPGERVACLVEEKYGRLDWVRRR